MVRDLKGFSRYTITGVANTFIHWAVVAVLCLGLEVRQSLGNLTGFVIAGTFSFLINGRYNFKSPLSWQRYLSFMVFMGGLSLAVGHLADVLNLPLIFTFIVFSAISLGIGYHYSKYIVFGR